jgi:hypothetical protein
MREVAGIPNDLEFGSRERRHRRSDRGPQPQGRYPYRNHGKVLLAACRLTYIPCRGRETEVGFAADSLLEGEGFEPPFPRRDSIFETAPEPGDDKPAR